MYTLRAEATFSRYELVCEKYRENVASARRVKSVLKKDNFLSILLLVRVFDFGKKLYCVDRISSKYLTEDKE